MSYASVILADHPRAYYRMNATSGAIEHDASGNGYDATLSGVAAYSQPGALIGDSDTSILFTVNGGLLVPYTLDYTTFSAFSSEFWSDASGSWQYVVVTCDGTTTIVYVNANVDTPAGGAPIEISSIFSFAGSPIASRLDEWAIYDYALVPAKITSHYAAHNVPHVLFPATARRGGTFPIPVRRTGIVPTVTRRTGTFPMAVRRTGTLPAANRRTGIFPTTVYRTGMFPSPRRRGGTFPVTVYRTGVLPTPSRRQS